MESLLPILVLALVVAVIAALARSWRANFDADRRPKPPVSEDVVVPLRPTTPSRAPFDAASATPTPSKPTLRGSAYVVDGDTIVIQKTQVRLFGVDAPEMNHPYGKKAKWALVHLCKGQAVRAEVTDTDDHGRTVAKCYLPDGRDLSEEMVKQGLAIDWPKFSGGKYRPLETPDARKKLWLADARQKGRMHVWEAYEAKKRARREGGVS
ncbi:thermonuclease family protein [Pseudooceanicola sp. 200-1SW]|uniref:thermonuclease family protein n=1 Tax=Pseudooceanicola sp. 200-1SW TaxID=3425949 RepID=UPI003D7F951D